LHGHLVLSLDECLGKLLWEEQWLLTLGTMSHDGLVIDSVPVACSAQTKGKGCDKSNVR